MPEIKEYEPGTPSWVDLGSPDIEASAAFYGGVFGWTFASAGPVEETGGYGMFTLNGLNSRNMQAMTLELAGTASWITNQTIQTAIQTSRTRGHISYGSCHPGTATQSATTKATRW